MKTPTATAGYFRNGLPYNRVGHGPRNLILLQGLMFENKPLPTFLTPLFNRYYQYLSSDYTIYIVLPKPGQPEGCSMRDLAQDCATLIREEFDGPVDLIGVSTGGSIAQHLAADHPELIRKLVIHSSAHTLGQVAKQAQMQTAQFARQRKWRAAYAAMFGPVLARAKNNPARLMGRVVTWLAGTFAAPKDPSDLVAIIEAEDKLAFKARLGEIKARTLVTGGDSDPYYPEALFRETAEGIPNARLIIYKGVGHPAAGKQFRQDLLNFLIENVTAR